MCVSVDRRRRDPLVAGSLRRTGELRLRIVHFRPAAECEHGREYGRDGERTTRGERLMTEAVSRRAAMAAGLSATTALLGGSASGAPVPKGDDNKSWVGKTM